MKNRKEIDLLPDQPLGEKLIKKGFWLYFFSYLIGPIGYFIRIIISNNLTVSDVWIVYSIIWFVSLLSSYNGLWLTESLRYFIPKYYIKKQFNFIKTSIFWSLWIQTLTSTLIIFFLRQGSDWLALNHFHSVEAGQILRYFCRYFLGINLFQVLQSVIISFQDTLISKLMEFIKMFAILSFSIIFFFIWKGSILTYSLAWILWLWVAMIIGIILSWKKYGFVLTAWKLSHDKVMLSKYWKYSLWAFLAMNAGVLLWMIDQQMIIVILWAENAWYYTNYLSLFNIIWILVSPIFMLLFPMFTEILAKKQMNKLKLLQNFLYTYLSLLTISLSVLLVVLGPEIVTILYGNKFIFSGILLSYGASFFVLNTLLSINFTILAGMGKVKQKTLITLLAAWVNIVLNLILLNTIWIYWALISTMFGWFLMWILTLGIINSNQKITIQWGVFLKNIFFFILMWAIVFLFKDRFMIYSRWVNLFILCWLGLIYYWFIFVLNYKKILNLRDEVSKMNR